MNWLPQFCKLQQTHYFEILFLHENGVLMRER